MILRAVRRGASISCRRIVEAPVPKGFSVKKIKTKDKSKWLNNKKYRHFDNPRQTYIDIKMIVNTVRKIQKFARLFKKKYLTLNG